MLWDLPNGLADVDAVCAAASRASVRSAPSIRTSFRPRSTNTGSFGNPDPDIRARAIAHCVESARIGAALGSRDLSLWFADGSNYPEYRQHSRPQTAVRHGLAAVHASRRHSGYASNTNRSSLLPPPMPIGAWRCCSREAGPQAKVLVDTGHHYPTQNIEQIVAWLLTSKCSAASTSTIAVTPTMT